MEGTAICSDVWSLSLILLFTPPICSLTNQWTYALLYLSSLPRESVRHNVLPQCKIIPLFVRKLRLQIFVLGNYYAEGFRRMTYWLVSVSCFSSFPLPFPGLQGASLSRFLPPPDCKYQWCLEDGMGRTPLLNFLFPLHPSHLLRHT